MGVSGGISLIKDLRERIQSTAGYTGPGQVVLSYTRKQAGQAIGSKPVSNMPP